MNPLAYFKIFNNEDCPCGSGKKFKECCKGKPDQQPIQSKKPPEVQIMEQMRKAMVKCCMHPDQSNCNGKIKNAHVLQNNKIISLLAGTERHVYTMDKKRQPLIIPIEGEEPEVVVEFSKVSANDATTEICLRNKRFYYQETFIAWIIIKILAENNSWKGKTWIEIQLEMKSRLK